MFRVLTVKKFAGELYHPCPDEPAERSSKERAARNELFCQKRITRLHRAVPAIMLKILGHDFLKTEIVRVGPKMRVEPGQLIGSRASKDSRGTPRSGAIISRRWNSADRGDRPPRSRPAKYTTLEPANDWPPFRIRFCLWDSTRLIAGSTGAESAVFLSIDSAVLVRVQDLEKTC